MKRLVNGIAGALLALFTLFAAAQETAAAGELAPRVDTIWVGVFLLVFVGLCAWFGISIYRAEAKNKKQVQES
jgi:hypothetical protein